MATRPFHPRTIPEETGAEPDAAELTAKSANLGREVAALLLLAAGTFLLLALCSFRRSPTDPSVEGSDWVGPVGATVTGWFVQGFGAVAWLVPLELGLVGYPLFRGRAIGPFGLRVAGDLIVGIVAASLVQVLWPDSIAFGGMQSSGNVGLLFGELMRGMFSTLGSLLVGTTVIGLVLLGRSAFSFIDLCERAVAACLRLLALARWLLVRVSAAWVEARSLRHCVTLAPATGSPIISTHLSERAIIAELADDEDEWIPFEQTGAPPIAILDALRTGPSQGTGEIGATHTPLAPVVATRGPGADGAVRIIEHPMRSGVPVLGHERATGEDANDLEEMVGEADTNDNCEAEADGTEDANEVEADEGEDLCEAEADGTEDASEVEADEGEDLCEAEGEDLCEAEGEDLCEAEGEERLQADDADADREANEDGSPPNGRRSGSKPRGQTKPKALPQPRIINRPESELQKGRLNVGRRATGYRLPATDLLAPATGTEPKIDRDRVLSHATRLEKTLLDYGVIGNVEEIHPGPTVTTFEFAPQAGTKVSKVASLADDLALGLSRKVRIIAPIPGKSRIGFELPNDQRIPVNLRELVEDPRFAALAEKAPLPVVLGRDIVGAPFYADLASMPHVIVAGATGAGKSVGLNVMLASLLFRRSPDELRLLMIDPKVVELAPFDRIPHLLLPVVTDMKQANQALKWAVDEMERRYQLFATAGTKNIGTYNRWVQRVTSGELSLPPPATVEALTQDGAIIAVGASDSGGDGRSLPGKLPYIVIVIDEFADLMMQQGKEVEASVARLAQKARAAGLHVVLATQRPSVDVITGMIKANFPSRIAYLVAQKVDSRTILDEQGAELLLGRGDMLVKMNGGNEVRRVQCPFISEDEVSALTDYIRTQGRPQYHDVILQQSDDDSSDAEGDVLDARFDEAVRIVAETQRCSTSWLQRKLTIGYNRAAKIVETMERRGMVGPPNGAKDREVLILPH
jgi:DNA segregation ATPase FtsK/SpoIIIE, S-DNA-T family